jgi:hypothetical protein
MQKERTHESGEGGVSSSPLSVAQARDREEAAVLGVLLYSDGPGLWSVEELVSVIGNRLGVIDGLKRLEGYGLIHRLGDFVFPSRAAVRSEQIKM